MAIRSAGLKALVAIGIVLWLARAAGAPPVSAGALDDAESSICMANSRLQGSVAAAGQDRRQPIPVEQLAGRIDNPASRARLQRELDSRLEQAQDQMIETNRGDLVRYQAAYRQLTGKDFDTAKCNGPRPRVTHAMMEQQRREADMNARMAQAGQSLAAGEAQRRADLRLSEACEARKVLDVPPQAAARLFPPGHVDNARRLYGDFVSSYQREHGTPFDPARCRPGAP
jgi:hypothetical protein